MEKQKSKTTATFQACLIQFFKVYDFSQQIVLAVGLGCAVFLLDYFDIKESKIYQDLEDGEKKRVKSYELLKLK